MTDITMTEITERQFMEALEVLPPRLQLSTSFLLGEPTDWRPCSITGAHAATWPAYFEVNGRFYAASPSLTIGEFRAFRLADLHKAAQAALSSPETLSGALANGVSGDI